MVRWLDSRRDFVARALLITSALCMFALALAIVSDVLIRLVNIPFYGVTEYIQNTLVVIVFLQLPYAVRTRSMISVDFLVRATPPSVQAITARVSNVFGFVFFSIVTWAAWSPAVRSWIENEVEGQLIVSVAAWPARFSVVVGCGLAALFYLIAAFRRDAAREQHNETAVSGVAAGA